jgi:hypothetical protein
VEAFHVLAKDLEQRQAAELAESIRAIAADGVRAAGEAAQDRGALAVFAFDDAVDIHEASIAKADAPRTDPRSRERRPRSRRTGGGSSSRASPDDDLADLPRRCPRCGGATRPLLPSPHWRCDPCADALWQMLFEHELERVVDEAERITGESA